MTFKRIIVLVMTLVMLVTACAPTLHVFAESVHDHAETQEKTELDYVSLGDAIASGTGLEKNDLPGLEGFMELSPESFAARFAAWLAGEEELKNYHWDKHREFYLYEGKNGSVNLMQYALNSARVEDILYLLSHKDIAEMSDEEFENSVDEWTIKVLDNIQHDTFTSAKDKAAWISSRLDYMKNADIISLSFGNATFGEYLVAVIEDYLNGGHKYDYMTLANAAEFFVDVDNEELEALVAEVYNEGYKALEGYGLSAGQLEVLSGRLAYIAASYVTSYEELIDLLVEMNPEVEIVIVPMIDTFENLNVEVDLGGVASVSLDDILTYVCAPVNGYLAVSLTVQKGLREYKNADFYYADLDKAVELLSSEVPACPTADGHKVIADSIIDAYDNGYKVQDETIENIQEVSTIIAAIVAEYYDEAYAYGYAYADENGYIDVAVDALGTAIDAIYVAIDEVEGGLLGIKDALKAEIVNELYATIATLEELRAVLASDAASDVEGLAKTVLALEDDLFTHLDNLYAICKQAGADIYEFVKPYIDEAYEYITTVVLPAVDAAIREFVDSTVAYLVEKLQPYYDKALEIYGITLDVYNRIVEAIVRLNLYVENAIDKAVEIYNQVVEVLLRVYNDVTNAVNTALEIYEYVLDTIATHKAHAEKLYNGIVDILERVYGDIETVKYVAGKVYAVVAKIFDILGIETIIDVVEIIYNVVGDVQTALEIAKAVIVYVIENREAIENGILTAKEIYEDLVELVGKIVDGVKVAIEVAEAVYPYVAKLVDVIGNVVEFLIENREEIEDEITFVYSACVDIINIIVDTYTATRDAYYTAVKVYEYLVMKAFEIKEITEDKMHNAVNGNYELKDESAYVSIGAENFSEELAKMLNLTEKHHVFGINDNYLEAVAGADLVTIKVDDDTYLDLAFDQCMGVVADIVRSNEDLMYLYNHSVVGEYVKEVLDEHDIDMSASTAELDWNKYLGAEEKEDLEESLALLKAALISRGVPEYCYYELGALVDQVFEENGIGDLPGISLEIDPIAVPVADLMVFAVENVLYAYAEFAYRINATLDNVHSVAPNATVVFVGITNPLDTYLAEYELGAEETMAVQTVVDVLNARIYAAAFLNENTIYVEENDAQAIYDALHVYCDHVYDDCVDTDCNRCLAVRVAPGHHFVNYVSNKDATCTKDGTKTGVCEGCGLEDTKVDIGSAFGHDWEKATCTTPKTCNTCGTTQGKALGHKFGNWVVTEEATRKHDGSQQRECSVCGFVEVEIIPMILPKYSAGTIIAVIVSAILCAAGIGALLMWRESKKDYVNEKEK